MKQNLIVILDNGHGRDTAGKRSPKWGDGSQLYEFEFNRDIVRRIGVMLDAESIEYRVLVPEDIDISLAERCRRANEIYKETRGRCFLVSVHANAGGGSGFEVYTSPRDTAADAMATTLFEEAQKEFPKEKMRSDYSDGDPDKESDFYILKHTFCPAVLSENFFMDTEKDCRLLFSEDGRERIAKYHVAAIKKIAL